MILEKIENLTGALILRVVRNTKQPSRVNFLHTECSTSVCYETRLKSQNVILPTDRIKIHRLRSFSRNAYSISKSEFIASTVSKCKCVSSFLEL